MSETEKAANDVSWGKLIGDAESRAVEKFNDEYFAAVEKGFKGSYEEYLESRLASLESEVERLQGQLARRSVALRFYADEVSWEYDKNGLHKFAGAFEPPTMIEADQGEKARVALAPSKGEQT